MLLVPPVVSGKVMTGRNLLMASDLEFVQMGEVTFGANVGQKMGNITESRLFGTNAAFEQWRGHSWKSLLCRLFFQLGGKGSGD